MIPFLSSADVLLAAGAVSGLSGLAGGVYLLARLQRPAKAPASAAAVSPAPAPAAAESKLTAAA
ncbi:MAG: hypothetical protein M3P50_09870 [Actinomycetota bacterium]|nr:hypothetical protein [Actinomycetota bacterium]